VAVSVPIIFLTGFTMFGSIIIIPLFFQGVLGLSATQSGSFLTPMVLGQVFGSFGSGQVLARTGGHYRIQGAVGLALMIIGLGLLTRITPNTSFGLADVDIILVGFGLGITLPLYTIALQNAVPYNILGAATSAVPFFRSMGGAVGLAILGSVMTGRFTTDFVAKLPETIKTLIPPQILSLIAHNPEVLVSPQAQTQLQNLLTQGPQGSALYQQTIGILRQALNAGLAEVFLIALIITVPAFIINFFLRKIPLRKEHALAEDSKSTDN